MCRFDLPVIGPSSQILVSRRPAWLPSLAAILALALCYQPARSETWTDNTGNFQVDAKFVDFDGKILVLQKNVGNTIRVPAQRLSAESLASARKLAAMETPVSPESKIIGSWRIDKQKSLKALDDLPIGSDAKNRGKTFISTRIESCLNLKFSKGGKVEMCRSDGPPKALTYTVITDDQGVISVDVAGQAPLILREEVLWGGPIGFTRVEAPAEDAFKQESSNTSNSLSGESADTSVSPESKIIGSWRIDKQKTLKALDDLPIGSDAKNRRKTFISTLNESCINLKFSKGGKVEMCRSDDDPPEASTYTVITDDQGVISVDVAGQTPLILREEVLWGGPIGFTRVEAPAEDAFKQESSNTPNSLSGESADTSVSPESRIIGRWAPDVEKIIKAIEADPPEGVTAEEFKEEHPGFLEELSGFEFRFAESGKLNVYIDGDENVGTYSLVGDGAIFNAELTWRGDPRKILMILTGDTLIIFPPPDVTPAVPVRASRIDVAEGAAATPEASVSPESRIIGRWAPDVEKIIKAIEADPPEGVTVEEFKEEYPEFLEELSGLEFRFAESGKLNVYIDGDEKVGTYSLVGDGAIFNAEPTWRGDDPKILMILTGDTLIIFPPPDVTPAVPVRASRIDVAEAAAARLEAGAAAPAVAARTFLKAIEAGDLAVIWSQLPPSYQADLNEVVHTFGRNMDPDIWKLGIGVAQKAVKILQTKQQFIHQSPTLADAAYYFIGADFNSFDATGKAIGPETITKNLDVPVTALTLLLNSDLANLEKLQTLDLAAFARGQGSEIMKQFSKLPTSAAGNLRSNEMAIFEPMSPFCLVDLDLKTNFGEAFESIVNAYIDVQLTENIPTLEISENGNYKWPFYFNREVFVTMALVEDKWIPSAVYWNRLDLKTNWDANPTPALWDSQMAAAKTGLLAMKPQLEANKTMIMLRLQIADGAADQILAAKSQEEFDRVITDVTKNIGAVLGPVIGDELTPGGKMYLPWLVPTKDGKVTE